MKVISSKYVRFLIVFFLLVFSNQLLKAQNETKAKDWIRGNVTVSGTPFKDVNILLKGSTDGTKTSRNGRFKIKTKIGDTLIFSHVGFINKEVIVKSRKEEINIKMRYLPNRLNEVSVTSKRMLSKYNKPKEFNSSYGYANLQAAGYASTYLERDQLLSHRVQLVDAIRGKIPGASVRRTSSGPSVYLRGGGSPAVWVVDGILFSGGGSPPINPLNVLDILVIRSTSAAVKYGPLARNGVIIVRTITDPFIEKEDFLDKFKNQNYYEGDAINTSDIAHQNDHLLELFNLDSDQAIFEKFEHTKSKKSLEFHLDLADYFFQKQPNRKKGLEVLLHAEEIFKNDPASLKAVAFYYDKYGFTPKSIDIYKQIFRLRPAHAQSYRDLANAYVNNGSYIMGWRIYMSYLYAGNNIDGGGIGKVFYKEMENLYSLKKHNPKESFKVEDIEAINQDVRMVAEWSDESAEFDLEFVNENGQAYLWTHSKISDVRRFEEENLIGYSSEEFLIEKLAKGKWQVNMTYLGSESTLPSYLKITTHFNWGKPYQKTKVDLIKMKLVDRKIKVNSFDNTAVTLALRN